MVDLDFERRMNPWLFDSSGNLTDAAKKQFPDLAAAASGTAAPAYTPSVPSGAPAVTVSVEALTRAATNVDTLKTKFAQACKQPSAHVSAVDSLLETPATTAANGTKQGLADGAVMTRAIHA
ncbi:hypothetical protein ACIRVF_26740 [Kitasatospora sp. NPDC101157]|uniref:hypothetical protein n=1 Tax=Kitasatospora sp. NPDC101157 TaxID=3364098 RepID=UPI00380C26B8